MYNRILKRPMFKRGGPSYEAQGTGITSPYDTPRKNYKIGAWGEWEEQVREQTKDPRGDWSYAAQGFSNLANPYKQSGEAKTIGEMLYEGAQNVRGSRENARTLEQKGEMAILENQAAQMNAAQAHKYKLEQIAASEAGKTYPDIHPGKLYDSRIVEWKRWLSQNEGRAGHSTVMGNLSAFAAADIVIRNEILKAYEKGKKSIAEAVSPAAYKDDGTLDISILSGGIVYFDPISKEWFTVSNAGTASAALIPANSYEEGWNNIGKTTTTITEETTEEPEKSSIEDDLKIKITTNLKDTELTDAVVYDEAAKIGIKIVERPPDAGRNWQVNLAENEMSLSRFRNILTKKKFADTHEHLQSSKKKRGNTLADFTETAEVAENLAHGGRAGYAFGATVLPQVDKDVTELEELNAWWKSQLNNTAWNKDEG